MADRQIGPVRVLRRLCVATSLALVLANLSIRLRGPPGIVLALIQLYALCVAPTTSLSTTIALSELGDAKRQYGPIRAMGTLGWMAGCWMVSLLGADSSTIAGFSGAVLWLGLSAFTFLLPEVAPPLSAQHLTMIQRLGLDALTLLKKSDHRVVFLTAALLSIPLAAFYPYMPPHLRDAGFDHPSAWLSLAQTTEIITMFSLGMLLMRWRLKWILVAGLAFGALRSGFCILNSKAWLLAGVVMHGSTYGLFFITVQIYINERVDPAWRTRAQALLTLLMNGVGNFIGYLGCGAWYRICQQASGTDWPLFWGGITGGVLSVLIYFLVAYRGIGAGFTPARTANR